MANTPLELKYFLNIITKTNNGIRIITNNEFDNAWQFTNDKFTLNFILFRSKILPILLLLKEINKYGLFAFSNPFPLYRV